MLDELTLAQITATSLITGWGFIQALLLEYVPGLKTQFGKLTPQWKASSQAISLGVITAGVWLLAYLDVFPSIAADTNTALYLFMTWIAALMANQTGHLTFKKRTPSS